MTRYNHPCKFCVGFCMTPWKCEKWVEYERERDENKTRYNENRLAPYVPVGYYSCSKCGDETNALKNSMRQIQYLCVPCHDEKNSYYTTFRGEREY